MSDNNSRELAFARSLEQVRRIAREQGNYISREQVRNEFSQMGLNDDQLEMVFDYLVKHGTGLDEPADPDGFLTREERDYLQDYLDELAALPVFSQGELEAFVISVLAGEETAKQRLTECFLRNVADIAKLYVGQGVLLEDLIGEGNVALAAGIDILGSMEEAGVIRKPSDVPGALTKLVMDAMERHIQENAENTRTDKKAADKVNLVADKARELAEQLRRKVTPKELAQETGLSVKAIQDAMRMSGYKIEDIG